MEAVDDSLSISILENSPDKYFCTLCSPVYSVCLNEINALEIHIRSVHPDSKCLRCVYCSELVSSVSISKHIEKHFSSTDVQNLPFICPCCPKAYSTMKALAQHALGLHNMNKSDVFFKCGHCDEFMETPMELKSHLNKYSLILYHCCFPNCRVKSRNPELVKQHAMKFHETNSPLIFTSYSFMCSWPSSVRPTALQCSSGVIKSTCRVPCSFFCAHCSFGTVHLESFAQHLAICRTISSHLLITSLSVTCVLHRCSECGWMTNVRSMLTEHIQDMHPLISEEDGVITEDFTVPISDESITENYNFISKNMENLRNSPLQQLPNFFSSGNSTFLHNNNGITLRNELPLLCPASSNLSAEVAKHLSNIHGPSSIDSCEVDEVGDGEDHTGVEGDNDEVKNLSKDNDANSRVVNSTLSNDVSATDSKSDNVTEATAEEYVQLYFNEQAFVTAYMKNEKFNNPNNDTENEELSSVLEKLRRFASYRVPILGRANQRRVAGCPECLKPFNHGFTDLKKHLLVTHLGVRRDISRFTIDFTHSSRNHSSGIASQSKDPRNNLSASPQVKHPFGIRNGRLSSKAFRRKPFPILSLSSPLSKRPNTGKYDDSQKSPTEPLATVSSDGLPTLVTPGSSYSGGAPVHRVIPGTGVSDHYEDMRSLEEVSAQAPIGRGGIIPLDEMGNPIVAAVVAAGQPQASTYSGGTEIFLPKVGRQRIQLAYSFPVFNRLLEAYQVPMPERIQLVNRMNHYARLHVIMDVLVPGGAQKRFSCPTCMYTSVHSLADIRKHIMGSHCGISTKRFRLCLRASRHDTTTYRLHSDDRMIRFVEDHRRRQIQLTDARSNLKVVHTDSDAEEIREESNETYSQLINDENSHYTNDLPRSQTSLNDQEELETQTIETDLYDDSHQEGIQGADEESDNRFLTANVNINSDENFLTPFKILDNSNPITNDNSPDENTKQTEEFHRRIELPFSDNVLRVLLEREGMLDQYDDLVAKMQIYSKHHLTVVSRGNRIYSYICICGRRFAVVRDEIESDIRPASLADCRRHILGVHARIPQELLTLCCQASRISKESGYKLYADTSLLALAEQHKFRSTRIQSYSRKPEGGISPIKRPLEAVSSNDSEGIPDTYVSTTSSNTITSRPSISYSSMSFSHSAPSQIALHHSSSYSANHPLPPMLRAPAVKYEPNDSGESPPRDCDRLNGKVPNIDSSKRSPEPNPYAFEERHSGLDLEAPRRVLTSEESAMWSQKLGLPTAWTLERIVRLLYSPAVFDHQVRSLLPEGDSFIASLHERMKVYARHSVYITRLREAPNPTQRIYVCCACLTTSHHGFGDVRKHILGVHAHVPERFKSAAMCSSRLNRDDYFLYTDSQLIQLANTPGRNASLSALGALSNKTLSPLNHSPASQKLRQNDSDYLSPQNTPKRKRRYSGTENDSVDLGIKSEPSSQFLPDECTTQTTHQNGHAAFSPDLPGKSYDDLDEHRPPIILTIPRPKTFHPSDQPDDLPPRFSSSMNNVVEKPVDEYLTADGVYSSSGSRSRRSMILKSKRPCPTST